MLKRTISWIATVMLLLGLTCGAAPSAFAADTEGNAQIGWITDFTDLTKWSSAKLDGTLASDLSSSDSTVNVAKGSVSETGFGATLFAGYSYTENGELFEQYGNDYYLAYQKVTIDLDAYPYLYTKYTPGATDSAFQLGVSLYDPVWTGIQTGEKTKNLCQGDGVEIDGKYRRVNLKSALGVEGEQTFYVYMGICYVNGAPWAMDYAFLGSNGTLQSDDAVADYVKQLNPGTFSVQVDAQPGGTVSGGVMGAAAGTEITVKAHRRQRLFLHRLVRGGNQGQRRSGVHLYPYRRCEPGCAFQDGRLVHGSEHAGGSLAVGGRLWQRDAYGLGG